MNRAENGDVKGTFNGYGDSDVYSVDVVHNACTGLSVSSNTVAKTVQLS